MHYYFDVLKKYAEFNGRARRKEFWMFCLISCIVGIVLSIIDAVLGFQVTFYTFDPDSIQTPLQSGVLNAIYSLAILIPSIAVTVRRLHDIDRTGWWVLMNLVCCVGWIVLLVFQVTPGTEGDNKYGPDPLNTN